MSPGRRWPLVLYALAGTSAAACRPEVVQSGAARAPAVIRAASTEPLWALAPPGATLAIVIADGAVAPLHAGLVTVVGTLERSPATAPLVGWIRAELSGPGLAVLDRARLAEIGIDLGRGAALFVDGSGPVVVLPVGDRKRLVAAVGGASQGGLDRMSGMMCREVSGRYACAADPALLDRLGKGGAASRIASWPAELRGHVEVEASLPAVDDLTLAMGLEGANRLRLGARLERGGANVRAHWVGRPTGPLAEARVRHTTRLAGRAADRSASGVFVLNAAGLWRQAVSRIQQRMPSTMLPGGVTLPELIGSIRGEAAGWALGDSGVVHIGLTDERPMARLLGACAALARALIVPGVKIGAKGDRCTVTLDPAALDPGSALIEPLSFEAWVDAGALSISSGSGERPRGKPPAAPTRFAREVLAAPHLFGAWGHGSLIGAKGFVGPDQLARATVDQAMAAAILFWVQHLSEFGIWLDVRDDGVHAALRVRTLWSNPDPVVAEVEKLLDDLAARRPGAEARAKDLGSRFPGTPLASDAAAGSSGLLLPSLSFMALPVVAKVAIESFAGEPAAEAEEGLPQPPTVVPQTELERGRVRGDKNIQPPVEDAITMAKTQRGTVGVVKMCLGADGRVNQVTTLKTTGFPRYDARIKEQVRTWEYRPFMLQGKPVPVCTSVTFIYRPARPKTPEQGEGPKAD